MTTTTFALKIGYTHYLMTPANAAKVLELLGSARCVSTEYLQDATQYVESDGEELAVVTFDKEIMTKAQRNEIRAAERAEYEAIKEARKAAEAADAANA